ncbi:hypothetical protein DPMN_144738 [Dreissena polymorpha]|uniref:Uncharacterized protein n=1 Tax=Dreissena polymorpha TaxID=45954 RepID=A0A9D4IY67_DREPO|nr:hypothetical protein DPMN_144738 [Dreissena polymorpha]
MLPSLTRTPAPVAVSSKTSLKVPSPWKSRGGGHMLLDDIHNGTMLISGEHFRN